MLRGLSSLRTAASRPFSTTAVAAASDSAAIPSFERRRPSSERRVPSSERRGPPSKPAVRASTDARKPSTSRPQRNSNGNGNATERSQPPARNRRRSVLSPPSPSAPRELPSMTTSDVTAELPDLSVDWSAAPMTSTSLAAIKTYPHLTLGAPASPSSTQGTTLARATFESHFSSAQYEARRKAKQYRPLRAAERALRVHLGPAAVAPGTLVLGLEEDRDMPGETVAVEGGDVTTMGDSVKEARVKRERAVLEKLGGDYARYKPAEILKAAGGADDVEGEEKWVLRDASRAVAGVDRLDPVGKSWLVRAIKGEMR